MEKRQRGSLLVYTRTATEEYSSSLANSIHLAYSDDGKTYRPLNNNYGMLFAKAEINNQNEIVEKGLTEPKICYDKKKGFCITAIRTNADGSRDTTCCGKVLLWTTQDFIHFEEYGVVGVEDCSFLRERPAEKTGRDKKCNLTDIIFGDEIEMQGELGEKMLMHWSTLYHTAVELPECIPAASAEDVQKVKATAVYSDGSAVKKKVQWDVSEIDFSVPGMYTVSGKIVPPKYGFPLAKGYADPDICYWNGAYYFIATNDNTDAIGLYIRCAKTVSALFEEGTEEYKILDRDFKRGFIQTFWAPELHMIDGSLYILFAVSGETFGPKCHMMRLKENGDPLKADDWETPIKVLDKDGKDLCEGGITLDMTYLKVKNRSYLVWSARMNCCTEGDTGSMLYIAEIEEKKPWSLKCNPVLLSRPLYGWENNNGTINNEGPFGLLTEDKLYLMYSGGAAGAESYTLGCLSISCEGNLLNPAEWEKSKTPLLSSYSIKGIYGPGHNSFAVDEDGDTVLLYHAQETAGRAQRCTGIHRVHFSKDGVPVLTMSKERDLDPALSEVKMNVCVCS